jgi:hypothetical protein
VLSLGRWGPSFSKREPDDGDKHGGARGNDRSDDGFPVRWIGWTGRGPGKNGRGHFIG